MIGRYRYLVVSVVWLALFLGAFDRTAVSILLVDPAFLQDMGLEGSPERQGLIMTALLLPYALSNIFVSPSADRWGPRRVLSAVAAGWGLTAIGLGTATSYVGLLAWRAIRGISEGPLFPVSNRYVRNWFPPSERGGANAIWSSGQRFGLALSIPILTAVTAFIGWRFAFLSQAVAIALLLLPAVWLLTGDRPGTTRRVGAEEAAHIAAGQKAGDTRAPNWRRDLPALLTNRLFWMAVAYHFATLGLYFGLVTWLPKYLRDGRGFDLGVMVVLATLPHILSALTGLVFGFASDRFRRKGPFLLGSLGGASLCVLLSALAPDPVVSSVFMVLGFGVWGAGSPAYYAIMQRIVPGQLMATGIGIDNGLSNFGSALAPAAVGFFIGATGSYLAGLLFLVGIGALGTAASVALVAKGY
jgi:sugar phosphate permease